MKILSPAADEQWSQKEESPIYIVMMVTDMDQSHFSNVFYLFIPINTSVAWCSLL